ncbi:hypothetical protein [Gordonia soli]|uniref:Uncharacterized protein n=1 Tax=Gordonia soli NBRC 108243 TaxID=1223545 RepID=M0QP31_9ACTN|nr:hypothetical protein [Gordonia soli]GAC69202.1 hypothetical protein GS4_22_00340 [Gordonia soli NBRC 108243]
MNAPQPPFGQQPPRHPQGYGPPPQAPRGPQFPPAGPPQQWPAGPQFPNQPYPPQQGQGAPQFRGQQPAPHQPPAAPPQQQGGPQGQSAIAVDTKFFPLSWFFFIKPKVAINGQLVPPTGWGRNVYSVPPGQHHVSVHVPYFLPSQVGPADATLVAHPGHITEVEYRAPLWAFSRGSLGPAPQQYNGVGPLVAVLGVTLLFIFILAFLPLIALG